MYQETGFNRLALEKQEHAQLVADDKKEMDEAQEIIDRAQAELNDQKSAFEKKRVEMETEIRCRSDQLDLDRASLDERSQERKRELDLERTNLEKRFQERKKELEERNATDRSVNEKVMKSS
jgi:hypothetical protein